MMLTNQKYDEMKHLYEACYEHARVVCGHDVPPQFGYGDDESDEEDNIVIAYTAEHKDACSKFLRMKWKLRRGKQDQKEEDKHEAARRLLKVQETATAGAPAAFRHLRLLIRATYARATRR